MLAVAWFLTDLLNKPIKTFSSLKIPNFKAVGSQMCWFLFAGFYCMCILDSFIRKEEKGKAAANSHGEMIRHEPDDPFRAIVH